MWAFTATLICGKAYIGLTKSPYFLLGERTEKAEVWLPITLVYLPEIDLLGICSKTKRTSALLMIIDPSLPKKRFMAMKTAGQPSDSKLGGRGVQKGGEGLSVRMGIL